MQGDFTRKLEMTRQQLGGLNTVGANTSEVVDPCAEYIICQNFETATTGYDNSETWTESVGDIVNPVYTPALYGSQSLRIRGNTASKTYVSLGGTVDPIYLFCHMKILTNSIAGVPVISFHPTMTTTSYVRLVNGPYFAGTHGGATALGSHTLSVGTKYWVWVHNQIEVGTSTNGILKVWYNTSGDYDTATLEINITTGTDSDATQSLCFGASDSLDIVIDHVLLSGTSGLILRDQA